jgi:transcriptional regulator with XRE-family HTH domain
MENESQEIDSGNLKAATQQSTSLNSRLNLIQRLRRNRATRARFVESNISKALAFQIRSLREKEGWSQQSLADKIDSNQNAVYRAENPSYGKQTITTLKKIAAAFDVALVVRFVPFSELVDWVSGTPRINAGLSTNALAIPSFEVEEESGLLEQQMVIPAPESYSN